MFVLPLILRFGLSMKSERVDNNPNWVDAYSPAGQVFNHYRCTIRRTAGKRRSFTVYYSMGPAHTNPPKIAEVLECLASDACGCVDQTFEAWAGDMGMDKDSRKAEKTYKAIVSNTRRLATFLGIEIEEFIRQVSREAA